MSSRLASHLDAIADCLTLERPFRTDDLAAHLRDIATALELAAGPAGSGTLELDAAVRATPDFDSDRWERVIGDFYANGSFGELAVEAVLEVASQGEFMGWARGFTS